MRVREALGRGAATLAVVTPFLLGYATTGGPPAADRDDVVVHFSDTDIVESSGLVALGGPGAGRFVTVNDSGDGARVFVVDAATGDTTAEVTYPGDPDDVEALAPAGPDAVWVGDIGDNTRARDSVTVHRVPLDGAGGEEHDLTYPDGARDAEALLAHPRTGQLVVVSKVVFGGQVYAAPTDLSADQPHRMTALGDVTGIVTDAAFFPDGRHFVVRTYTQAVVYAWPSIEQVGSFELPAQQQGEGIAVARDGQVYVSSEGRRAPVLRVDLPGDVRRGMEAPRPSEAATADASGEDGSGTDVFAQAAAERPVLPWVAGLLVLLALVWVAARASRPPR